MFPLMKSEGNKEEAEFPGRRWNKRRVARPASQDPPKFLLRKTFQPSYENCAIFSCSLCYSCSVRKSFSSSMLQRAQFTCLPQVSYESYRQQLCKQPTVSLTRPPCNFSWDIFSSLFFFLFFFYNSSQLVYFFVWNDLKNKPEDTMNWAFQQNWKII